METEFVTNEFAAAGVLTKKQFLFKVVFKDFHKLKSAIERIIRYLIDEIRLYLKQGAILQRYTALYLLSYYKIGTVS